MLPIEAVLSDLKDIKQTLNKILEALNIPLEHPIHTASRKNETEEILQLLNENPDWLELQDDSGHTPIILAAANGHALLVEYLATINANLSAAINEPDSDEHGYTPLHCAVKHGHLAVFKCLLAYGADINILAGEDKTHLVHLAAQYGRREILDILLEKNPECLELMDAYGQTPLIWAAAGGHVDMLDYLVAIGASLSVTTNRPGHPDHGKSPIHWAIQYGHAHAFKCLCHYGADISMLSVEIQLRAFLIAEKHGWLEILERLLTKNPGLLNLTDDCGQNAVLWAAANGHAHAVVYLAKNNADLSVATNDPDHHCHGYTALHWAVMNGHLASFKCLLEYGADINALAGETKTHPVHLAAKHGRLEMLYILLEINPECMEQQDENGQTPLLWAAAKGHARTVKYLLTINADLSVATNDPEHHCHGYTALHWAVMNGHLDSFKCLLEYGADINALAGKTKTHPIHLAAKHGRLEMLYILLQKNPEWLDITDALGQSPVILAAAEGHVKIVDFLLLNKANLTLTTHEPNSPTHGFNAIQWAKYKNHKPIFKRLLQACMIDMAKDETYLIHQAAAAGDLEMVQLLLKSQPELLNQRDKQGYTPLIHAAKNNQISVIEYLISKGANVNLAIDDPDDLWHGQTALYMVVRYQGNQSDIINLLIEAGALDIPVDGEYLIHYAARHGDLEMVQLLLKNQPELANQVSQYGDTPLSLAVDHQHIPVVQYLLSKQGNLNVIVRHSTILRKVERWGSEEMKAVCKANNNSVVPRGDADVGKSGNHITPISQNATFYLGCNCFLLGVITVLGAHYFKTNAGLAIGTGLLVASSIFGIARRVYNENDSHDNNLKLD